ncbi:MAG TPA: NUDIX hydrolase [Gemmatimonadales bacterium]|jgi:ADP-ribose pyrophosphatase|nr:NUDIX hydrolase [Gemmatimonadales bacterium]
MPLVSTTRLHSGRIVNLDLDTVRFPDDSLGQLEMLRHPGASAVVPFLDPPGGADPRVLLIRQFRHAAEGYIWEVPAGRLDPGERPEACAARELEEETGMRARRLERLTTIFTTPGFTDERIHLFLAEGLEPGAEHREADEFMELHTLRWSEVLGMVERGEVSDGKTLVSLLFVQSFRR